MTAHSSALRIAEAQCGVDRIEQVEGRLYAASLWLGPKPVLHPGVAAGLMAAALFGVGTQAATLLLSSVVQ